MNINASIIDQRIAGIIEEYAAYLPAGTDINIKKSAAFVLLSMSTSLDISIDDAAELLTEGSKVNDLSGTANYPENGVQKAVNTIATLFDPSKQIELNDKIAPRVEEIRSLVDVHNFKFHENHAAKRF
ncbi:MAG: hypothetical protein V1753_11210 [Pseudomonadota bacterium]